MNACGKDSRGMTRRAMQINSYEPRYLRQIFGIAIEGHRWARKSRSLSCPRVPDSRTSRSASGANAGTHAFTHLRAFARTNYELYAARAYVQHALGGSRGLYACIYEPRYARTRIARSNGDSIVSRTYGSHASRWRSCKLNICRLACTNAHTCRKILIFISASSVTTAKGGY